MNINVLQSGLITTIQDLGRVGYQKYGVIVGGVMDTYALRMGNILIGNKEGEGALEIALIGPCLNMTKGTLFSITGGDFLPTIDEEPVPMWRPVYLNRDAILKFSNCRVGCYGYLCVAGGFDLPEVMGSKSTYIKAGIGGYSGRALKKGDRINLNSPEAQSVNIINVLRRKLPSQIFTTANWYVRGCKEENSTYSFIRVIRGRNFKDFTEESLERFFHNPFKISHESDRMGYRLLGPTLKLRRTFDMISEAVSFGTVQIPPDGNPIVLLADRQTTGGYPKIAEIASVDIGKIVHMKPGEKIIFKEISLEDAESLYFYKEKYIGDLKKAIYLKNSINFEI
ncbi:biotin-dependent carboxyltransferase family protein [Clostridium kluyveri]|uniref:KipI antagonist n=1 Tax=Clostridium kluyveri TaxID=1534 RepID=A0A1L5FAM1_CLOKL|nr:biotin-dependent carboxyltransferase family protein [Clostridium kluyveri]APM40065.1 KipI antagonist [Clostridium kluyveri]